jgi:hypothetical protein
MTMKRLALPFLSVILLVPSNAWADTLVLKDGSEIKGEIISEAPEGVVVEYFVTSTIKDQKTFPRDMIAKTVVVTEDEKAFQALGSRATPPTVLDAAFHDSLIEKKIPEFLKLYPYSKHVPELREDLKSLDQERSRLRKGDRRIDGEWLTAAQIEADPYQSGSRLKFTEMKEFARNNDQVDCLRCFELLEKEYPGSAVMPEAVELALARIDLLQDELSAAKANFAVIEKKRQNALSAARADQAKEIKDAIEQENVAFKAAKMNAEKDGTKFFNIFPNIKDALDALQAVANAEKIRLALLLQTPMRDSLVASRDAARLLSLGSLKEARDQLAAAEKLWPSNAEVVTLKKQLDDAAKAAPPVKK